MSYARTTEPLDLATFGAALRKSRTDHSYSLYNLAKHLRKTTASQIDEWERGYAAPPKLVLKALTTMAPELRIFERDLREGNFKRVRRPGESDRPALPTGSLEDIRKQFLAQGVEQEAEPSIVAEPEFKPATFGEALRGLRTRAHMGRGELGRLCEVHASAIGHWERDTWTPVLDNYNKLLTLWPELATMPKPRSQDIDKPEGTPGGYAVDDDDEVPTTGPEPETEDQEPECFAELEAQAEDQPPMAQPEPKQLSVVTNAPAPAVDIQAIQRWTMASAKLKLSAEQAAAVSELLQAADALGMDLAGVATILEAWPNRT